MVGTVASLVFALSGAPALAEGVDSDADGVCNRDEDLDGDGDLTDEDSDGDGAPDFEDPDDDGDGVLTRDEDVDGDGDPRNDDLDEDGDPDYLDENVPRDVDGDGFDAPAYGGDDCDDRDVQAYPGAYDKPYDGVDRDCAGDDDDDFDGDGFADERRAGGGDCDDRDPNVYPGASEALDDVDQDCDGWTDPIGTLVPRGGCSCTIPPEGVLPHRLSSVGGRTLDPTSASAWTLLLGLSPWLLLRRRT